MPSRQRSAIRRGDLDGAERWFRVATRAVAMAEFLVDMGRDKQRPRAQP